MAINLDESLTQQSSQLTISALMELAQRAGIERIIYNIKRKTFYLCLEGDSKTQAVVAEDLLPLLVALVRKRESGK